MPGIPRSVLVPVAAVVSLGVAAASAAPIPSGPGLGPVRVRTELADVKDPHRKATEFLELSRDGATYTFRWALRFRDGTEWSEVAVGEVRDAKVIPIRVHRIERDHQGKLELEITALDLSGSTVKLQVSRGGDPKEEEIDVDDPPLYPPVMTGTLYQHLFEANAQPLKFSTLADYPWGLGAAPMEASLAEKPETIQSRLGELLCRRVTLRPVMPWPLSTMVDAIGIDTSVYLWVGAESPHALTRYEGSYRSDSGRFRGDAVEIEWLPDGAGSPTWPPQAQPAAGGTAEPQSAASGAAP